MTWPHERSSVAQYDRWIGNNSQPPPEKLHLGVVGIVYTVDQLTAAAVLLSSPFHVTEELGGINIDHPVRNALVESFLINARRLTTFLRDDKPREVCAKHYLPTWTKWEFGGEIIGLVSETLAHVTYREKPQPYKVRTIINPLAAGTTEFVRQLAASESVWHPHFEPVVELLSRRLPAISDIG